MIRVNRVSTAASAMVFLLWAIAAGAQSVTSASGTTYRVFLTSGEPLPSYGEPVFVDDRVIFNLLVGSAAGTPEVQLVSLPASAVDSERTTRYAHAMRAAHYAATRGESDYAALTAEVARALEQLTTISDLRRRLALAEGARRQLLAWSEDHYQYRGNDIRELALLFDGVITELKIAVGESGVTLDLVARSAPLEPLMPPPTLRESIALAMTAARFADIGVERVDILRRASEAATRLDDAVVRETVSTTLGEEVRAGTAYASLVRAMRARAEVARRRGDVAALERITLQLEQQDQQLGQRRPAEMREFTAHLSATLDATRAFREALDAHTRQLAGMRRYDARVRPLLDRFDRLGPVLSTLREMRGMTAAQLSTMDAELARLARDIETVRPPMALANVHATFRNVLLLAREAAVRRRLARSSQASEIREASAAASGARLLAGQVRRDLAASLRRPTIQ
jgi:hypothetical protein